MLKAVKVRLYPTQEQKEIISSQIGAVRYIYNRMLALKSFVYKRYGKTLSKYELINRIKKLKNKDKTSWLKDIDSQALQQSIGNLELAYKNFFRRVKNGEKVGFPKFKTRHYSKQSYQYPQRVKLSDDKTKLYLPKVGWVKMRGFRENFVGKIKTVTIYFEASQYSAAILIDDGITTVEPSYNGQSVGIDVGVKLVVADSNGNMIKPLDLSKEYIKLKKRQKKLSAKERSSKNRYKAKQKLAKIHKKIANKRKDFLHKLSTKYSENQTVVVEDLNIKAMSKSSKGTIEKAGKNVKSKSGLNRVITQQSWGMFFDMLKYKLEARGGKLIKVNPQYTSQTCPKCKSISKENRLTQSEFVCKECGYSNNADVVASINILDRGIPG